MCGSAACEAVPAVEHLLHGWCNHRNCGDAGCLAWPGIHAVARHAHALHLAAKAGRYPDPHDGTGCGWWWPVRHSMDTGGENRSCLLCEWRVVLKRKIQRGMWHLHKRQIRFLEARRTGAVWLSFVREVSDVAVVVSLQFQLFGRRKDWRAVLRRWHLLLDQVGAGVVTDDADAKHHGQSVGRIRHCRGCSFSRSC